MIRKFRESYRFSGGLEQAVVDLVRTGCAGSGSGVRQLASRLIRTVPPEISDPAAFAASLQEAMRAGVESAGLRFVAEDLPVEAGTDLPLVSIDDTPDSDGLVLNSFNASELAEIVEERRRVDELLRSGVRLTGTVLLCGPPGVGKTMTARWLAAEVGVPLVAIDLSSLVSSFLGTTGRNLRSVFDFAGKRPCVLLLDEFDALAKRRDDDTDVGELKRIVNVLLAELDRWPNSNLLVAATNHRHLLDPAVDRRFDRIITLSLPDVRERGAILCHLAKSARLDLAPILEVAAAATSGMTGADLVGLWNGVRRRAALRGEDLGRMLLTEIGQRGPHQGKARDQLCRAMADQLGFSNRQIATYTGVSHPTVAAALLRTRSSE
ncbi:MAG: AAA family ATPase [Chloroflexota bacterium]|nr:MAG: AAA family ATPase [Chloroflexota bacterium]